jgi:tetratricopeptide (TPR) repeat protein
MPRPEAAALFQLSKLYAESGDLARAEDRVITGLAASRQLVDMYVLPRHLASAAEIKSQLGKSKEAAGLYDEATDLVEAMLVNVPSPRLRTSLIAAMSRIYVGHFRLAVEQLRDPQRAFFIVERARGRVAADELRTPAPAAAVRTPAMAKAERSITDIQVRLQRATDPEQRHELLEELFVAEENLGPPSLEWRTTNRFAVSEPVTIADLRRVLDDDEILVEYVLAEPSSYALTVSKKAVRVHRLPPESLIRDLVER